MSLSNDTGGAPAVAPPVAPAVAPPTGWANEFIPGAISVAIGVAVIIYSSTMPPLGDGRPGPGLFPSVIAGFLIVLGLVLVLRGVLLKSGKAAPTQEEIAVAETEKALPKTQQWVNPLVVLAAMAFYIVFAEILGFILTLVIVVAGLMLFLKAKWWVALITAGVLTGVLFLVFQTLLLVRLPMGIFA